jgi:hypothetical protein
VSISAKDLNDLLTLLNPPLRGVFPFQLPDQNTNPQDVRQGLQKLVQALRTGRDYQRMAVCEFNTGLYHLEWNERHQAHGYFHKARFHASLANDDPFVCLAYFAESCAHNLSDTAPAYSVYRKAHTSLRNFKGLLRTNQTRRLVVFTLRLEQQLERWRRILEEETLRRPTESGQLVTDDEHVYQWFEVNQSLGRLLRGFQRGDWVLAEMNQSEDGVMSWGEVLVIGRKSQLGVIRLQPYPPVTPQQPWYMGQIKEWRRELNGITFHPWEPDEEVAMRPRDIEGIVITHYQERGLIDLV